MTNETILISAAQPARDLATERAQASFPIETMRNYLIGGADQAALKDTAYNLISRDPILSYGSVGHPFDMTRPQLREKTMAQIRRSVEVRRGLFRSDLADDPTRDVRDRDLERHFMVAMCELSESFSMRLFVSDALFARSFRMFGTPEQAARWVPMVRRWEVVGCFGMTEIGHSSNLRGISTTATYDHKAQEFIINTPDIMGTKFWIGAVGETATHASVLCRLVVGDQDCGLHWFLVQLRDTKTGRIMPGVALGDIGAKAGRNGLDNGWMQFTHVRTPRGNMYARWARVTAEGRFESGLAANDPARSQVSDAAAASLSYAGLIPERLEITRGVPMAVNQALTIAIRYAALRRQGPTGNPPILDYATQQAALLPPLALMHAVMAADAGVWARWGKMEGNPAALVKGLADMHALSSGIKSMVTWRGSDALEMVRRAMGGHAFSRYNAIADAQADFGVMTTGGGDNYVLVQQTTRYLLSETARAAKNLGSGKASGPADPEASTYYLSNLADHVGAESLPAISNWSDLGAMHAHLVRLTIIKLTRLGTALRKAGKKGGAAAWNAHLRDVSDLAVLHTHLFLMRAMRRRVGDLPSGPNDGPVAPAELRGALLDLAALYFTDTLDRHARDLMAECGWSGDQARALQQAVADHSAKVRVNAVALVDAFGYPDFILKSPLARADGSGYEAYLNTIKAAEGGWGGVPEYHGREIAPLTGQAKL
ncbi:acyl-CoA dehydrogenase/oxidase [Blastocladiella britannica]|nr:acyl-CoA dehydrogenase/oxidase [Blastocladiella britannica]